MRKRILVTGSTGFTGRYVCKELNRSGFDVYGLSHDCSITGVPVDICDKEAIKEVIKRVSPQGVIHLAAIANVAHSCESDFTKVNVEGTLNLLEAVSDSLANISHVIIASSANVYGSVSSITPITEETPPNPQNAYAMSKLMMEQEVLRNFKGYPITILRPFSYTGIGQSKNFIIPKIVNAFQRGNSVLELGNINVSRDFSDVRYVALVYCSLLKMDSLSDIFNVSSGKPTSLTEVIGMCQDISGRSIQVVSKESLRRENDIHTLCGDSTKLSRRIGFKSTYSLKDTLSWMFSAESNM